MSRAVELQPQEPAFWSEAVPSLQGAQHEPPLRDALIVVLQPTRQRVEHTAIRRGLDAALIAETKARPDGRTGGHFEDDLIHCYLPVYLARASHRDVRVSFRVHAQRTYQNALGQRARREREREQQWRAAPPDPRTVQEVEARAADGTSAPQPAATHYAHWVPTPAEMYETRDLMRNLQSALSPLDYQIAVLLMDSDSCQGNYRDIAERLSRDSCRILPSRITSAIKRIRAAYLEITSRQA